MKHKDSGWRCLLAHYNPDGTMAPQCIICEGCGEHISPKNMDEECPPEARLGFRSWKTFKDQSHETHDS